jgi:hypothetical protein
MAYNFPKMRGDIPCFDANMHWHCEVCEKYIEPDKSFYEYPDKYHYFPISRYWNGYGSEVFCSVDCSFTWHLSHP